MFKILRNNEIIERKNSIIKARQRIQNTNLVIQYSKKARKQYEELKNA